MEILNKNFGCDITPIIFEPLLKQCTKYNIPEPLKNIYIDYFLHINEIYSNNVIFHGTGLYAYKRPDLSVYSPLVYILRDGLQPMVDDWITGNPMHSISLANRPHAGFYANMNRSPEHSTQWFYGSPEMWFLYFTAHNLVDAHRNIGERPLADMYSFRSMIFDDSTKLRNWFSQKNPNLKSNLMPWEKLSTILTTSSNIPGNFPVNIGVNYQTLTFTQLPNGFPHELRSLNPIGLEHITHIEVPYSAIEQVKRLVGYFSRDIMVIPIEATELYMALEMPIDMLTYPVRKLVSKSRN